MFCKTIHGVEFQVDSEDYERFVEGYRFKISPQGYIVYSSTKDGYHNKLLHRVIMGNPPGQCIDHKNRDKLDNRSENLRTATYRQNECNKGLKSTNKSGFKGVCWHKGTQKWHARVRIDGKEITLGFYKHKIKAAMVAAIARIVAHGEFVSH
jgi:hypothetical protein